MIAVNISAISLILLNLFFFYNKEICSYDLSLGSLRFVGLKRKNNIKNIIKSWSNKNKFKVKK